MSTSSPELRSASSSPVLEARQLTKTYRMGAVEVAALRGVDLDLDVGDRARHRTVTIGARSDLAVEIRDGIKAGQRVIRYPGERVSDGSTIVER
ncbi:hypothetical protein ACGTN6_05555 [Halomonas sp. THAF12]|uniref:hypothetical protein n=1 Tax=Halomonas sp. B23F22_10 TaxID=3459515 RepID=UPI00373ED998